MAKTKIMNEKKVTPKESTQKDYEREVETVINGEKAPEAEVKTDKLGRVKDYNSDRMVFETADKYNEYLKNKKD